jgi:hypothetical protein
MGFYIPEDGILYVNSSQSYGSLGFFYFEVNNGRTEKEPQNKLTHKYKHNNLTLKYY